MIAFPPMLSLLKSNLKLSLFLSCFTFNMILPSYIAFPAVPSLWFLNDTVQTPERGDKILKTL